MDDGELIASALTWKVKEDAQILGRMITPEQKRAYAEARQRGRLDHGGYEYQWANAVLAHLGQDPLPDPLCSIQPGLQELCATGDKGIIEDKVFEVLTRTLGQAALAHPNEGYLELYYDLGGDDEQLETLREAAVSRGVSGYILSSLSEQLLAGPYEDRAEAERAAALLDGDWEVLPVYSPEYLNAKVGSGAGANTAP
jgi:hypothetical protein